MVFPTSKPWPSCSQANSSLKTLIHSYPLVLHKSQKLGDEKMSCQEIIVEMKEIENARKELSSEKGVTGKNVAAVVFFWPALIATHSNVNDAMRALNERKNHLMDIYNKKGCPSIVK